MKSVIALLCLVSLAGCSVLLAGIDWDQHRNLEWDVGALYTTGDGCGVTAVVVGSGIGNVGSRTGSTMGRQVQADNVGPMRLRC